MLRVLLAGFALPLLATSVMAQSTIGSSPFGTHPAPPSAYQQPGDPTGALPSGVGRFLGNPMSSPYPAPQWGRYGENGWTLAPATPPPAYGMDPNGTLFYTDPQTGLTQYYGPGETRYRGRFTP